jgi:hypothetical protein
MSLKAILRILAVLFIAISFHSIRALAQDDAPSVAEAARRARQQKQDAPKPAKVIDNDTLVPASSTKAASTATPSNAPDANTAPTTENNGAPADKPKAESGKSGDQTDEDAKKAEIEALKKQIADLKTKVDLQQREISLQQDSFLSNPDHEHDTAGKEKLDSMETDLTQAKSELADLLAKIAALVPDAADTKIPESAPSKP